MADRTAELAANEDRLKRSQEIAHLGSWELDLVNNCLSWSDETYRIFGLKPQEFPATYEAFLEAVHPDDRAAVDDAYSGSVSEGRDTYEIEHRLIRKLDGAVRIVHEKCEHLRDDSGQIIRSVGMVHDITERRRMEEELRENKSRLDLALRSAQMGVWHLDLIENKRRFDYQACHLLGIAPAKFTGTEEEFYEAIHPDDREMLKAVWNRTIQQLVPYETEYRAVWPDGSIHYLTARGKFVHDSEGQPLKVNGLIWDITERKRTEKQLSRSYEFTRAILDTVDGLIVILDPNGHIVRFNSACERLTGWRANEVIGRCFWEFLIPEEQRAGVRTTFKELTEGIFPNRHENDWIARDGCRRWITWANSVLLDESGKIEYVIGTGIDITDRKQMEDELRKSRDELELRVQERTAELNSYMAKLDQSNQALQDFASIAAHDMKEPLRKVISFGNMLRQKSGKSMGQSGNDYLNRMLNATERMQSLLTGLLDYSRVATTAEPFKEVDLSGLIGEVLSDLEVRVVKTGGEVYVETLPVISADPTQMRQLFQNLIGNALKFHKPGEKPTVRVRSVSNTDSGCQIIVEDNGIGFEEQYLGRIFAPFQRLHGRSEYEGTGMGLAICKKIVERHGGSITANSTPGAGTSFIVRLPLRQST